MNIMFTNNETRCTELMTINNELMDWGTDEEFINEVLDYLNQCETKDGNWYASKSSE